MTRILRLTLWQWLFLAAMAAGAHAGYVRAVYGLGGSTNLSDSFPWGIWIGFDVLCGVGLATGGFTLAAMVYVLNLRRYEPIVRPAIVTALLGYVLEILALLFDLGRPDRMWHSLVMWNPRSPMFEVAWCVALGTVVLFLQFLPAVLERFGLARSLKWARLTLIPLVIVGALLSALHQSMLGSLYLIVPRKLHLLWYSPHLPALFYVSAICAGLAMTIFESWHSSKVFGRRLETPLLAGLSRPLGALLLLYAAMRAADLWQRGVWRLAFQPRLQSYLFILEILLVLLPIAILIRPPDRQSPLALYSGSVMVLFGFVANRLNVSITAMQAGAVTPYFPRWTELAATVAICALGVAIFGLLARRLPLYPGHPNAQPLTTHSPTFVSDELP